jgi:riboflavin synthase
MKISNNIGMFTGLVQAVGRVAKVANDGYGGRILTIVESEIAPRLTLGESVAVNGACLTVVEQNGESFHFQVGPETLARTNLASLAIGDPVNLERSLQVGDHLGGHFVTGHIDAIGTIVERTKFGEWETVWFDCPKSLDELMVVKGSIAVDGVSLTLVDVQVGRFSVMLIPHTLAHTTLGVKPIGAKVNLECDLIARHVAKLFKHLHAPKP